MKGILLFLPLMLIGTTSIYDFEIDGLMDKKIRLSDYKGKKILIVNVASKCGFTPQYEGLQKLYEKYQEELIVIGFPANDFGKQEPGTNEEIATFCETNYGITFPLSTKITVKGDDMHPLYKWLTTKDLNGHSDSEVKWNFQKYLIDEQGNLIGVFRSKVKPLSPELIDAIEN
jgi:glutathione peroxidase